ncbi:MAG TPA: MFS transporter, partial [Actinomycetota bacterium]|nr:MFS transporter [Actinomycetota bacterium]
MTPEPTRRRSWLLSGDFGRFWLGQTISNLGSSFTMFALPLLVFNLTGSPIHLGITTAAEFVPYLLFGLVIGAWVDRVDRRRLMIATDLARAAVIATIPLLAAFDALSVGWIYAVAFASATLTIAFDAAEFAAIPSLVPSGDDLVTANGRVQASYSTAQIAGPLLAGLLVAVAPVQQVLLVDAASFLVSAGALAMIGRAFNAPREEGPRRAIRQDILDGLRYVLGHPVLRNISAMMALINLVGATVYAQLVVFAKRQLEASDSQVALLYAAGSAGVVLLSLAAGPLRRRLSFSVAALGALTLDGL